MSLKVEIESTDAAERIVDADIEQFNEWFRGLGNDSLVKPERAIIKTYLAWKLGLAKHGG